MQFSSVHRNIRVEQVTRVIKITHVERATELVHVNRTFNVNNVSRSFNSRRVIRDITVNKISRAVQINHVGRRGPRGEQGIQGNPGSGGDKNYLLDFTNSAVVTITHGLSKYPAVTITDSAGDEVEGEVEHINTAQLVTRFSASFTGRIVCN